MERLLRLLALPAAALLAFACGRPAGQPASVAELLVAADSGHLLARRRAIRDLAAASPSTSAEMERLVAAAGNGSRRKLQRAALSALSNVSARDAALKPWCFRLLGEDSAGLQRAGCAVCRTFGVPDAEPRVDEVCRIFSGRVPAAPPSVGFAELALMQQRLDGIAKTAAEADPAEVRRLGEVGVNLSRAGDAEGLLLLLDRKAFLVGGMTAGQLAAAGGRAVLPRAEALAAGDDVLARGAGLGIVLHMRDAAAVKDLRRLAAGKDRELASCAKEALQALEEKR